MSSLGDYAKSNLGDAKVVCGLQVQPGACVSAKVASESHGRIRGDGTPLAHDFINARNPGRSAP